MAKVAWRTMYTPPTGLDYEDYTGQESEVDQSAYEDTAVTVARILRGEKVLGARTLHYGDEVDPTRTRGYDWADADKDAAGIKDRQEDRARLAEEAKAKKLKDAKAAAKAAKKAAEQVKPAQAANDAAQGGSVG